VTVRPVRDAVLRQEVKKVIGRSVEIPDRPGYGGAGAPGKMLEEQLHIRANNQDLPDAGRWEVKYTSDASYLTLFHKDPRPRRPSVVADLVRGCGWERGGHVSFRHTVWGRSARGFEVRVGPGRVSVANAQHPEIEPYWTVDELNNSAVTKLRNLLLVLGRVEKSGGRRTVRFEAARMYSGFRFSEFCAGLREGRIAVDFDARTAGGGIRNHGTKFRTRARDLARLYGDMERVEA